MSTIYEQVPAELKTLRQWVCFMLADNPEKGKPDKIPISPRTLTGAKANDPTTWTSFAEAEAALGKQGSAYVRRKKEYILVTGTLCGVGFEFASGYFGVDIDHVEEAIAGYRAGGRGNIVAEFVEGLASYAEYSPSGTGIHILCRGSIPPHGNRRGNVEMYQAGRYFTVTGNPVSAEYLEITDCTERIKPLFEKYLRTPPKPKPLPMPLIPATMADEELLQKILDSAQGGKFSELFAGNWEGRFPSQSEAEMSLCEILAFWCGRDTARMDRIFRRSGLMREKWDEQRGQETYGAMTVRRAAERCAAVYDPAYHRTTALEDFLCVAEGEKPFPQLEDLKRYSLDDMGASRLFADTFQGQLLFLPEYKSFWAYREGVWEQDKQDMRARQLAKLWADYVRALLPASESRQPAEDQWTAYRKHYGKYSTLRNREILVRDVRDELHSDSADFNRNPFLLNCKNGVLDLRTLTLKPHSPAGRFSKQANVSYDSSAICPRWGKFIGEITENDQGRARALQKALGYALKGEANEECFFLAIGKRTRNGKGTLFDSVMNLLGTYGAQMDFSTIARSGAKDGSRPTPDLARLIGTRLVLSNEPEKGIAINEALLKQLTGNDDITCRPMYGDVIQFKPVFTLFVSANSKPTVSDDSLFASDRVKMLNFPHHFTEEERDTNLKAFFRSEESKSAILNWLLEGYRLYCEEGIKDTQEMRTLAVEYRRENDLVGMYIEDRFDRTQKGLTTIKQLRTDYAQWCAVMGVMPLGVKLFKEELEKHEIPLKRAHGRDCINGQLRNDFDIYDRSTRVDADDKG